MQRLVVLQERVHVPSILEGGRCNGMQAAAGVEQLNRPMLAECRERETCCAWTTAARAVIATRVVHHHQDGHVLEECHERKTCAWTTAARALIATRIVHRRLVIFLARGHRKHQRYMWNTCPRTRAAASAAEVDHRRVCFAAIRCSAQVLWSDLKGLVACMTQRSSTHEAKLSKRSIIRPQSRHTNKTGRVMS